MTTPTTPAYLWWNGQRRPWADGTIHVTELWWSTVSAVFEGIRAYWNAEQGELYVFRLEEHLRRLLDSQKLVRMRIDYDLTQLTEAVTDLLRANDHRHDAYIRPLAYFSGEHKGFQNAGRAVPCDLLIDTMPVGSGLLSGQGWTAGVVSWRRIDDTIMPPRVKNISNYRNSQLAGTEARQNGYDTAVILNTAGKVSEGPGACLVLVKDDVVVTPDLSSSILPSITRDAVLQLARAGLGLPVVERTVERTELYLADEVFLVGTMAEITPLVEIDRYAIGDGTIGPITGQLQRLFHDVARGIDERYAHWRTPVGLTAAARV
jgi:branched-chain amino acid aminotransferase